MKKYNTIPFDKVSKKHTTNRNRIKIFLFVACSLLINVSTYLTFLLDLFNWNSLQKSKSNRLSLCILFPSRD